MNVVTDIEPQVRYHHYFKLYFAEVSIKLDGEYELIDMGKEICSMFFIPDKVFYQNAKKCKANLKIWHDFPLFENKQNAEEFLDSLMPYFVMRQLTM